MALNRFNSPTKYYSRAQTITQNITCVFISHQQKDKTEAKKVADFLMAADIDVYFDGYDVDLKIHHQSNNAKAVTEAIKKGINNSSHMLAMVSPNNISSTWGPFEVGFGHDKTNLSILCLKKNQKGHLPDYLKISYIVRDILDINNFVARISGRDEIRLMSERKINSHYSPVHPLSSVMDDLIHEG